MGTLAPLEGRLVLNSSGFSQNLQKVGKEADQFASKLKNFGGISSLQKGLAETDTKLAGFAGSLGTIMTLGGAGAVIATVGTAINKALEFGEAGARLENLSRSFENFTQRAGQSSNEMLAKLQTASRGTIAQAELMESYNKATLLVGKSMANDLPRLMQVAVAASAAGMGDVNDMLNSLVLGVGRLQPEILDNLGLTIKMGSAYDTYAQSIGKTADMLNDTEKKQATVNEIMRVAEDRFGNLDKVAQGAAGGGIQDLKSSFTDFVDYLKEEVAPAIDDIAERAAKAISAKTPGTKEWQSEQYKELENLISRMAEERLEPTVNWSDTGWKGVWERLIYRSLLFRPSYTYGQYNEIMRQKNKNADDNQYIKYAENLDVAKLSSEKYLAIVRLMNTEDSKATQILTSKRAAISSSNSALLAMEAAANPAAFGISNIADEVKKAGWDFSKCTTEAQRLKVVLDALGGNLDTARANAWGRYQAMDTSRKPAGIDPLTGDAWYYGDQPTARDSIDDVIKGTNAYDDFGAAGSSAYDSITSSLENYLNAYESSITSIMQPTMDYGSMAQQYLPHQNAWDENARRMAALMNDPGNTMKQDWFGEFSAKFAVPTNLPVDQIRTFAANWLQQFQLGLDPSAVDWAAFVQKYQQQLQQKQAQADMLVRAEAELKNAGLGIDNVEIQKALGFPLAGAGEDAGDGFANSLIGQLNNRLGDLQSAATASGKTVTEAFMAGSDKVADKWISALISKLDARYMLRNDYQR